MVKPKLTWNLIVAISCTQVASGYRAGEPIDVDVRFGTEKHDVLRSQTPLFGIDTTAEFPGGTESFSMTFEDRVWGLPSIPMSRKDGQSLAKWEISLVYSKSGEGEIHTVTYGLPEYTRQSDRDGTTFSIHYRWIEEPELRTQAGQTVMLLFVIVASVYVLSSSLDEDDTNDVQGSNGRAGAVPKYD